MVARHTGDGKRCRKRWLAAAFIWRRLACAI
jgi:hypothetical protein